MDVSSPATPSAPSPTVSTRDRVIVVLGAASVALALAVAVAGALGVLPDAGAVLVILALSGLTLRVVMILRTRRVGPLASASTVRTVSLGLLGVSLVSVIASYIVVVSRTGAVSAAADDLIRNGVVVLVLVGISLPSRTLGWQPAVGAAMVGFLAAPALSRLVGLPAVDALGTDSIWASSVWVPITEEVIKALPAALLALLASSSRDGRPSVTDIVVVGGASGAGFALFEDLQYQRAPGDLWALPPFSILFPTIEQAQYDGTTLIVAGHAIWTAVVALGIGFGVLWRRRLRFAWIALPVALMIATLEHGVLNVGTSVGPLTLVIAGGALSTILLVAGAITVTALERRPLRGADGVVAGLTLHPAGVAAQRRRLAALQTAGGAR